MYTTEEMLKCDKENNWKEYEGRGAYKQKDDAWRMEWPSSENEIKIRASEEYTKRIKVWKCRAPVPSSEQIRIFTAGFKQVWGSHSISDSQEKDHIDDNTERQK